MVGTIDSHTELAMHVGEAKGADDVHSDSRIRARVGRGYTPLP